MLPQLDSRLGGTTRGVAVLKIGLSLSGGRGLHLNVPEKSENRVETW